MSDHHHGAGCGCGQHHVPAADPHAIRQPGQVSLTGQLVCRDMAEMLAILDHAQSHVDASRAEPGCLMFDLRQTDDPMIWTVAELFRDVAAYRAHQDRTRASDWGRAIAAIERRGFIRRGLD